MVSETNNGHLNDIRSLPIEQEDVFAAITSAKEGPVEEGAVGAGIGSVGFGFKGGIGTSAGAFRPHSVATPLGLVQTNFGGILSVAGVSVAQELGDHYLKHYSGENKGTNRTPAQTADGSIMIVVATDAPLEHRNLSGMAARRLKPTVPSPLNDANDQRPVVSCE
jgi:D-aminopeptidase